jgi:hypothetical protein
VEPALPDVPAAPAEASVSAPASCIVVPPAPAFEPPVPSKRLASSLEHDATNIPTVATMIGKRAARFVCMDESLAQGMGRSKTVREARTGSRRHGTDEGRNARSK